MLLTLIALALPLPAFQAPLPTSLPDLVRRYDTDRAALERFYPHERTDAFDRRMAEFEGRFRARLEALDYGALGVSERVDWHLLANELAGSADARALRRRRTAEMSELVPMMAEVFALDSARRRLEAVEPREVARRLDAFADRLDELRDVVRAAEEGEEPDEGAVTTTPVVAQRAARTVRDMKRALRQWFDHYAGYEPEFAWWVREPYERLGAALDDYEAHLRRKVCGLRGEADDPLIGDPIGREALELAVRRELIAYSPEELLSVAEREFAWCEGEMRRAARELGFEDDWRAALEHVKTLHEPAGGQDELIAGQARYAIEFLDERELVTIEPLCRETWNLEMISPDRQRTLPYGYYGGQHMAIAYPTSGMEHADKEMVMRGNNRHFTRIVTPHELIPGHHLQGYMAQRYAAHRRPFRTAFLVEGWCLHWEMLLWDLDYARGPEDRIGMLFWRMHRCARITVSLRFHLGEWSPEEMIDYLVERVGHERQGATSEVRRYVGEDYGPLYQCAYMVGGLQVRALYYELRDAGRTPREIHDAILRCNSIPIELIRAEVRGEELPRDWTPSWRFPARQ